MNIAQAFHAGDKEQTRRWLAWVEELGGLGRHKLFLMPAKGQQADFRTSLPFTVVVDEWGVTSDWSQSNASVRDASAPNTMVRQFAWHFYLQKLGPWMFCEPDAIPLRPTAFDELEDEYRRSGKVFMGARVRVPNVDEHATGNMIFPQDAAAHCKNLMLPVHAKIEDRYVELAFDVAAAPDIIGPHFHETRLIQHVFRGATFEKMDDLARIDPAACLFHTDKDGGLISLLRKRRAGLETPPAESHKRDTEIPAPVPTKPNVFTYFRPCVDVAALAEQRRILAIWEKNWRDAGWEPIILTETHARKHPEFERYRKAFEAMPTVSPKDYEMACWLRWMAMAVIGGGFMIDYDVLSNGYEGGHWMLKGDGKLPLIMSANNPVPCAVIGTREQYQNAIDAFLTCSIGTEQGKPHLSDMLAVQALKFPAVDICREFGKPGWKEAKLIHFSHASVRGNRSKPMDEFATGAQPIVAKHENDRDTGFFTAEYQPTSAECIAQLVELSKKDGFAKGRIVKQLRKAGLLPKKK